MCSKHDGARLHAYGDYAKTRAEFEARQPMGRLGKPEEIAALALHLASDESGFTTGQIHVIDGGCPLMFDPVADPAHKVMRWVLTLTGKVPQRCN